MVLYLSAYGIIPIHIPKSTLVKGQRTSTLHKYNAVFVSANLTQHHFQIMKSHPDRFQGDQNINIYYVLPYKRTSSPSTQPTGLRYD